MYHYLLRRKVKITKANIKIKDKKCIPKIIKANVKITEANIKIKDKITKANIKIKAKNVSQEYLMVFNGI